MKRKWNYISRIFHVSYNITNRRRFKNGEIESTKNSQQIPNIRIFALVKQTNINNLFVSKFVQAKLEYNGQNHNITDRVGYTSAV